MNIARAKPDDADTLTAIAHAAKRHWGYPESWIALWRDGLTIRPEFIAANVAFIAIEDQLPVGFYILTTEVGGIHLDHLWMVPAAMRRGIGRALFEHARRRQEISDSTRSGSRRTQTRSGFTNAWGQNASGFASARWKARGANFR
jgi:GNAT superfamily N-acetyltransferase